MSAGDALKRRRLMMGLTSVDLSVKSGVGNTTIWRVETGKFKPQADTAAKLCRAVGWPDDALYRMLAGENPEAFVHAKPSTERNEDADLKSRVWALETRVAELEALIRHRARRK